MAFLFFWHRNNMKRVSPPRSTILLCAAILAKEYTQMSEDRDSRRYDVE